MFKFKVGDEVLVTSGKDKGKRGKIEKVLPKQDRLVVAGVNLYKRHKKVSRTRPAGIFEFTRPIPTANVAIVCPKCAKATKVGFAQEGKTKIRICRKCRGSIST
ncbi:50S ribosomal protein L24 [Candidatus Curtissbacteria bacterium]|nr:50S ribosomal protein L24 [Candidatus Curtissbacteria bacterium]